MKLLSYLHLLFIAQISSACSPSLVTHPLQEKIQQLLPAFDTLKECADITNGMTNNVVLCRTQSGKEYAFRYPRALEDSLHFKRITELAQRAGHLHIGPRIYHINEPDQQLLMHGIDAMQWPEYEKDEQPYHDTMQLLQRFHMQMPTDNGAQWCPFKWILNNEIVGNPLLPAQFALALERVQALQEKCAEWLCKNAKMCHGDFHKGNVLLERESRRPWIIDLDSATMGHPYFDVVKFCFKLKLPQRNALFKTYLDHTPCKQEQEQYTLIEKAFLMVIATVRFRLALTKPPSDLLSKIQMEEMLNKQILPPCKSVPTNDASPKVKQLGAIYALHEFLRS